MGYRDELDAARERIDTLTRENAALEKKLRGNDRSGESGAALSVGLGIVALLASLGLAATWTHASALAETSDEVSRTLRTREAELTALRRVLATASDGCSRCEGLPDHGSVDRLASWLREEPVREAWRAYVVESIGAAPIAVGTACLASVEALPRAARDSDDDPRCTLRIVCDDQSAFPAPGETSSVPCSLTRGGHLSVSGELDTDTTRRVHGVRNALRIDEGPAGAWSLLIEE